MNEDPSYAPQTVTATPNPVTESALSLGPQATRKQYADAAVMLAREVEKIEEQIGCKFDRCLLRMITETLINIPA